MAREELKLDVSVGGIEQIEKLSVSLRNLVTSSAGMTRKTQNMDAAQRALSQAVGVTNKGLKEHAKTIGEARSNQRALSNELNNLRSAIRQTDLRIKSLNGSFAQKQALKDFNAQLKITERNLNKIRPRALVSDLRSLSVQFKKAGKDAQFVGRSLIIGLTTPILNFANRGLDAFKALDAELVRLKKILGEAFLGNEQKGFVELLDRERDGLNKLGYELENVTTRMGAFEQVTLQMSQKFGVSRDLVTAVTADFAELGIASTDVLLGLAEVTNQLSVLGSMDISESQELLQTMFLGTIRSLDLMGREFSSALEKQEVALEAATNQLYLFNAIENNTALSFRDMARSIPEASSAATIFGLTMTQTAALLAPMKAAGIDVSTAANGLKVALQRLATPTKILQTTMSELTGRVGDQKDELQGYFEEINGVGIHSIQSLVDATNLLRDATDDEAVIKFYAQLFEKRQATRMLTSIDSLIQFQKELNETSIEPSGQTLSKILENITLQSGFAAQGLGTTVRNIEEFVNITKVANAQVGESVGGVTEAATAGQIEAAKKARQAFRDYVADVEKNSEEGIQVVDQISSQAGKALLVELLGAANAQQLAQEELSIALASSSKQIDRMRIAFKNIATDIIQSVEPAIRKVSSAVVAASGAIANLPQGVKQLLVVFAAAVASIGPLVFIFGQLKLAVGVMGGVLFKFLPGIQALSVESIAAAPNLLRMKNAITMNGDALTTSASRMQRFIATASSGRGPIARMARAYGEATGILSKELTAPADVLSRVGMKTAAGESALTMLDARLNEIASQSGIVLASAGEVAGNSIRDGAIEAAAILRGTTVGAISPTQVGRGDQKIRRAPGIFGDEDVNFPAATFAPKTPKTPNVTGPILGPTALPPSAKDIDDAVKRMVSDLVNTPAGAISGYQAGMNVRTIAGMSPGMSASDFEIQPVGPPMNKAQYRKRAMDQMFASGIQYRGQNLPDFEIQKALQDFDFDQSTGRVRDKATGKLLRAGSRQEKIVQIVRQKVADAEQEALDEFNRDRLIRSQNRAARRRLDALRVQAEKDAADKFAKTEALKRTNDANTLKSQKNITAQTKKREKARQITARQDEIFARSGIKRSMGKFGGELQLDGRTISEKQAKRIAMGGAGGRVTAATQRGLARADQAITKVKKRPTEVIGKIFKGSEEERALVRQRQIAGRPAKGPDAPRVDPTSILNVRKQKALTAASSLVGADKATARIKELNKQANLLGVQGPGAFRKMRIRSAEFAKTTASSSGIFAKLAKVISSPFALLSKTFNILAKIPFIGKVFQLIGAFAKLGNILKIVKGGIAVFAMAGVAAGIAVLLPLIKAVIDNFSLFKEKIQPGINALSATFKVLKEIGVALLSPFQDLFAALSGGADEATQVGKIADIFNKIASFVFLASLKVQDFVNQYVVPFMKKAFGAFMTIVEGFKGIVKAAIGMKNGAAGAGEKMKEALKTVGLGILQFFLGTLAPALINVFAAIAKGVFRVLLKLVENLPTILGYMVKLFFELLPQVLKVFRFITVNSLKLLAHLPEGIGFILEKAINLFTDFVRGAIDRLGPIAQFFAKVFGVNAVLTAFDKVGSGLHSLGKGATSAALSVVSGIDGILGSLIEGLEGMNTDKVVDIGKDLSAKLGDAMAGAPGAFDGFIDSARDAATDALARFVPQPVADRLAGTMKDTVEDELGSEELYEPTIDAAGDAGESAGENFADKFKDALKDLRQKFVDLVGDYLKDEISDASDRLIDALETQRDAALKVFDDQLSVIDKLSQAEESLMREREYIANRKKALDERELNRQNYIRNRALAIYEGRIDDARMLDLEEQKSSIESAQSIEELDRKRNEDLRKENLEFIRNQIKEAKKEADEFFKAQIDAFKEASKEITRFAPQTIEDYEKQLNELKNLATQFATANGEQFALTFQAMQEKIEQDMPNKAISPFEFQLDELIAVANAKYGLADESVGILGATIGMLNGIEGSISSNTGISTSFDELLESLKVDVIQVGLDEINQVIADKDPAQTLLDAITFAQESILNEWRGTVGHITSAVDPLANMMDPMIANILEAQMALDEMASKAASAGQAVAESVGAAPGGAGGGPGGGGGVGSGGASGGGANARKPAATLALEELDGLRNWVRINMAGFSQSVKNQIFDAITKIESNFKTNPSARIRGLIYSEVLNGISSSVVKGQLGVYMQRMYPNITPSTAGGGSAGGRIRMANGGYVRKFGMGGYNVPGFNNQSIPALLHGGEFVVNSRAVSRIGMATLQAMNDMRFKSPGRMGGGQNVTTINKTENINIYVDTFIGEDKWFNEMMDQYNIKMRPIQDKKRGGEVRVFDSYSYRAGR